MPQRNGKSLDTQINNARQSIALLRSQIQSGHIDSDYFIKRLDALTQLFDDINAERRDQADTERFAKLYEVSRAIGSSLDLDEVLNQVMDAIIKLTGAERGYLMMQNDNGALDVRIARNFDQESLETGEGAASRTITHQVFENGEPVITTNATEDPRFAAQASIIAQQLRSIMAAPMRSRGKIIGVVYVDNRVKAGLFRERDLELLEAFAGQAAVAIENARLFGETDEKLARRVDELETLQWIDRQFSETLDNIRTMDLTVEWTMRVCEADSASLAMYNPITDELQVMSHVGEADNLSTTQSHLPVTQLVEQVLQTSQPSYETLGDYSLFCVPIVRETRTIGVVLVSAHRANAFDAEVQGLVTRIADRAAIAIENARLYDELKRANEAKSEFVGTVAHELKVPMTSISGYADLLSQFSELSEKDQRSVTRIKDSVIRMQQLVEDLSDISRIESGNLRIEIVAVDLHDLIEQAKSSVMSQIEEREHRLGEDIPRDVPLVLADPARIVQIFINLLSNAIKYTPNGGQISISAQPSNNRVFVSVTDSGVGMSPEELEKLGTKFWRSANRHSRKQRGTGLGFSITRQLIESMNCTLAIESEVGQGSVFTVGIPVSEGA